MHTREEIATHLVERLDWRVARREERRGARQLLKQEPVDAMYSLEEGALLDEFVHFWDQVGVLSRWHAWQGEGIPRERVDFFQYVMLYGMKTVFGIESMNALPELVFSDEAARRLAGVHARQIREGICRRSQEKRQGTKAAGPLCPDTVANNMVKLSMSAMETFLNGVIQDLAQAGVFPRQVTVILDGTDLETTAKDEGCGHVTRTRTITAKHGKVRQIEVTVYGWQLIVFSEAMTKIPLAAQMVTIQEHEAAFPRELVTQARVTLGSQVRLQRVLCDRGFLDGADLWWLHQQGLRFVVPAKEDRAVTVDARALAAAGEGTVGRCVRTGAQGQGTQAWTARLETEVVGIADLTTYDQYGPEEDARRHRKDFQGHPLHAVVVRTWNHRAYGPGGKTVFRTNEAVDKPLKPFHAYDDRSLIENCGIKESKHAWHLKHPPTKTESGGQVQVFCTLVVFALATAYRQQREQDTLGDKAVGWQRWRR